MRPSASLSLNLFGSTAANPNRPLQPADARHLSDFLRDEATEYFYSAYVSICDALTGLDKGYYSWATVKLYYATFYCASPKFLVFLLQEHQNNLDISVLYVAPELKMTVRM